MVETMRTATLRVYDELTARGLPDPRAFETAVTVFRHRFPALPGDDARFIVADWICDSLGQ